MVQSLRPPKQNSEIDLLKKGLDRIGLTLSNTELNELNIGNIITLEKMELDKIGSVFILASAVFATRLGNSKKSITFKDLPKTVQECECCSGIPIHSWNSDSVPGRRYLYLTVINSAPAVRVCCRS
ncbi:MAG: hypothetical protein QNJ54_05310 [Prochloraceae cyanobacterium]|nr:hypothetical protein [Prochloraceae cyanobacterium]